MVNFPNEVSCISLLKNCSMNNYLLVPALKGFGEVFKTLDGLGATAGGIFLVVPGESFMFKF